MLLNIDNLTVRYGGIEALHDVSLRVDAGEIVTLIGANGAGKTTLLRTISGLLKPTRGEIQFEKKSGQAVELTKLKPHAIVRLGISHAPEGRKIFAPLSVIENLRLGGYQQNSREAMQNDIEKCFTLFPVLAERKNQKAGTLSGGEQQMLAIGRALMARPRVLLLDEPSLGLAPLIVRKIFEIIREIHAAGTTVFLVEQNAHLALTIADRAYVLQSGQVTKSDIAKNLLEDPDVKRAYLGG